MTSMIERRAFVGGLGALVAVPLAAAAQQGDKVRRVGVVLGAASSSPGAKNLKLVRDTLQFKGYHTIEAGTGVWRATNSGRSY